jgi:hypothetical protein
MHAMIEAVRRMLARLTDKKPRHAPLPGPLPHNAKYEDFVRPR